MTSNKLILIDIFSYSCMNCLRSLGYLNKIGKEYQKFGLKTILIHPPEWEFEKNKKNILHFKKNFKIKFPIIIDKDKKFIKKVNVNFWPAQILMKNNKILYQHIGEGNYKNLELKIIKFLKIKSKIIFKNEPEYTKFPTIYLGRRKNGKILKLKNKLKFGVVYKIGNWKQKKEFAQNIGKGSCLAILTKGRIINFVAQSLNKNPISVSITLNNKFIKKLTVNKPRLYNIIKLKNNKANKLILTTNSNLAIYSFSFQ